MNREIEKKFIVGNTDKTIQEILDIAAGCLDKSFRIHGSSSGIDLDIYWDLGGEAYPQTLRLRRKDGGSSEITYKRKDKENNVNRVEENLEVYGFEQALALLKAVHGMPNGEVSKLYTKIKFIGGEIAVYRVIGSSITYLEIEAQSEKQVDKLANRIGKHLWLELEPRSVYELFIGSDV